MKNAVITKKQISDLCYLIYCALHKRNPEEECIAKMDFALLYKLAYEQSLSAITYMALEGTDALENSSAALRETWQQKKDATIRKNILFDNERKNITEKMEKEKIWYMPLKGALLKDLYPHYGMRQMADNDILYDKSCQGKLRTLMESLGYKTDQYNEEFHDVYHKLPIYSFEMHPVLFSKIHEKELYTYYVNIKERLLPDPDKKYSFHFTDEDFYIYMMAHAYKHFIDGGNGLRHFVDTYVYLSKKSSVMDWNYIKRETKKLKIDKFEERCRIISKKLFDFSCSSDSKSLSSHPIDMDKFAAKFTKDEWEILFYCIASKTFGTIENKLRKTKVKETGMPTFQKITFKTKLKYCWQRLYFSQELCEEFYPFFAKHRYLKPFLMIYRILHTVFFKPKQLKAEIKNIKNAK